MFSWRKRRKKKDKRNDGGMLQTDKIILTAIQEETEELEVVQGILEVKEKKTKILGVGGSIGGWKSCYCPME